MAIILSAALLLCSGCGRAETAEEIKLTLACWIEDYELEQRVDYYNSKQDEYEIEIVAFYDPQNPNTDFDSAQKNMTVRLLTGEVADIFYLDSMDTASLENAGILADLYPIMQADSDFDPDDYFMNILQLFEVDGALYEFAPQFQLGCICGGESLLGDRTGWTIDEYNAFASDYGDVLPLGVSRDAMMSFLIQFGITDFIDVQGGTCSFDTPEFEEVLRFASQFPEKTTSSILNSVWFGGVDDYLSYKVSNGEAPRFVGYPSGYSSGPCAMALGSYGISSGTEYKDAAWDFIMSILDEDQPDIIITSATGFPIVKAEFEDDLRRAQLSADDEQSLAYGMTDSRGNPAEPLTAEDADYIRSLIENVSDVRFRNSEVLSIIKEEAAVYFAGDKTAEEVAALIQSRVSLYLAEQG
jgi:ABC-type glycerol-3-phosphate transport system substrate-binding protein